MIKDRVFVCLGGVLGRLLVMGLVVGGVEGVVMGQGSTQGSKEGIGESAGQILEMTKVHTIHLMFSAEEWRGMEPRGVKGFAFGPPAADFGPGTFTAPVFMAAGDKDRDGRLTREEFGDLAEKWFTEWDRKKSGKLTAEEIRRGVNGTFAVSGGGVGAVRIEQPRHPGLMLQGREGRRNGLASAMGLEFGYVHADVDFDGRSYRNVGVRYKGNGTWVESTGSIKRSMKIQFNRFTKGQKLAGLSTVNLHCCVTDASFMNEVMSHRLFRDALVPACRTAYARVYVTVPGKHERKYFGLYSLVENIDEDFVKEAFGTKGGALFKPVTPYPFTDMGPLFAAYEQTYDPKMPLSVGEKQRLIDLCRLVSQAEDREFAAKLPEFVDLDNFSRFMAIEVYLSTLDSILSIGQNYYVYLHPGTKKLHFMGWDLDHSFGQFPMIGSQQQREQLSIHHPWRGDIRFLERVFKVEQFKSLYLARLEEFSRTLFRPERFAEQVDAIAAAIRPAVKEESEVKLTRLNRVAAGQRADGPGAFDAFLGRGRGALVQSPAPIKPFTAARTQSIMDQLSGKSAGLRLPEGGFGAAPAPPAAGGSGPVRGGGGDVAVGRGGFGGPGGPGPGPGNLNSGDFGPGVFLAPALVGAFDANKDGSLSRGELVAGFGNWFTAWNTDGSGRLTEQQIRAGLNQVMGPAGPGSWGPPTAPLNPRGPAPMRP